MVRQSLSRPPRRFLYILSAVPVVCLLLAALLLAPLAYGQHPSAAPAAPVTYTLVINEILFNPPGIDSPNEYVELWGDPNATIAAGTYLVGVEGDAAGNPGDVQNIFDLSGKSLGANGFLVLLQKGNSYTVDPNAGVYTNSSNGPGWGSGGSSSIGHTGAGGQTDIENATATFLLIQTATTPTIADDIDANNDGTPDGSAYAGWTILDSVGALDNTAAAGDFAYGAINFKHGSSSGASQTGIVITESFTAGYLGRSGNTTGAAGADWVAGDILGGSAPAWTLGTAANTEPASFAGKALDHIGAGNFLPSPVTVTESANGTLVSESGITDTYTLNLIAAPTGPVTITAQADTQLEISRDGVSFFPAVTLTLSTTAPQTITVKAVDDLLVEGSHSGAISHTISGTDDPIAFPTSTAIAHVIATITDNDIPGGPFLAISAIQGAAHISPMAGQVVSNVYGIVTAVTGNGFYMQDAVPDNDPATSEGIFVFTGAAPGRAVGDAVVVAGQVSEFRSGGSGLNNLTITELTAPSVILVSSGNPLPAPTVIGQGGRVPPDTVIEDDATGDVETGAVFDPAADGIDFYESLEGMLVQVNDAVVVGPRNGFGEIPVLGDNGANGGVRTARGGIVVRATDFNPERIILDDEILQLAGLSTPTVNVSDTFSVPITGVLDYGFGNFKLQVSMPPSAISGNLHKESTAAAAFSQLTIATFNVENLSPDDPQAKFNNLAAVIVNNLRSPDIVAVEEIQDNSGATDNGVVDATLTFAKLISATVSAGGPVYDYRSINPVNNQDGGQPGGNIRTGFLFRTDRGLSFIDRPGGGPITATTVISASGMAQLSASPGRIDPTNAAFNASRKPLAAEFSYKGHKLFVIANHFNSKGGDDALFGHVQPPVLVSEAQRHQQAQVVHDFVNGILTLDPGANVVVLGDLNDFEFSSTVTILKGAILHDLVDTLPQHERYTYVFGGNSQTLDHILVSGHLLNQVSFTYDIVHVNAEFADQVSDHDPQQVRFALPFTCYDFNGNGRVDIGDVQASAAAFGSGPDTDYDVNQSGVVDIVDLVQVANQWPRNCP